MLRRNERRLNFKNRPVRTGDLKGVLNSSPPATNRGSQEPATNRVNRTRQSIKGPFSSLEDSSYPQMNDQLSRELLGLLRRQSMKRIHSNESSLVQGQVQ